MKVPYFPLLTFLCISHISLSFPAFAQDVHVTETPMVNWTSKDTTDAVTIQNGTGLSLTITINVSNAGSGINVSNCGSTIHVDAGSSAICSTQDPVNPVKFSADTLGAPASGTYQVKQQQPGT